jgi:hypothetical protein
MKADICVMLEELSKTYFVTVENVDPGDYDELPEGGWSVELEDRNDDRSYTGVWIGKTLPGCVSRAWAEEPEDLTG